MELVAMELKQSGLFLARTLSYEVCLSPYRLHICLEVHQRAGWCWRHQGPLQPLRPRSICFY